jgi:hypothetical protein
MHDIRFARAEASVGEATSVNDNVSTHPEPDPTAHITDAEIYRASAKQREERAAPISKLAAFRGYKRFHSSMRSLLKVGQLEKGKKSRSGKTYIHNDLETACELLGVPFQFEQTDYDDNDPHVIEAATDSNAEARRDTQGQAIGMAVRTRLFHEGIQKERPFHPVPTYDALAEKFTGSKRAATIKALTRTASAFVSSADNYQPVFTDLRPVAERRTEKHGRIPGEGVWRLRRHRGRRRWPVVRL